MERNAVRVRFLFSIFLQHSLYLNRSFHPMAYKHSKAGNFGATKLDDPSTIPYQRVPVGIRIL